MRFWPAWIEAKDLPAWLQAAAALIALGLSSWAVLATKRAAVDARLADVEDARLRAKIVAAAIVTDLEIIQGDIDRLKAKFMYPFDLEQILRDSDAEQIAEAGIKLPPMIERSLPRLHWLGESAGEIMVILVANILGLDRLLGQMDANLKRQGIGRIMEWINVISPHIELLGTTLSKAKHDVGLVHFGPDGYPAEPSGGNFTNTLSSSCSS